MRSKLNYFQILVKSFSVLLVPSIEHIGHVLYFLQFINLFILRDVTTTMFFCPGIKNLSFNNYQSDLISLKTSTTSTSPACS